MTLIKSISGIRGTIGGKAGEGLSPVDAVKYAAAYAQWLKEQKNLPGKKIVVGRDARISGSMVNHLVKGTLLGMGFDVVDIGLATTPTTEMAVIEENAAGGVILTASHNPKQWNALKLLNAKGEFISAEEGARLLQIVEEEAYVFSDVDALGEESEESNYTMHHIQKILELNLVDVEAIRKASFKVVVDAVNSVGGIAIPKLLKELGVQDVIEMYCEPSGEFPHNPEPLAENLTAISEKVQQEKAHLGFVVDPDVDRLAIVNEDGTMFGEEYTLVAVADYVLSNSKGNAVSNMSSSRALRDITEKHGGSYEASAVGEVNVVEKMKEIKAVIGGEGNGGVIYPELHYGRDALVGIALFLTHLAHSKLSCKELRKTYPEYKIIKRKIELKPDMNVDAILKEVEKHYSPKDVNTIDGVKIEMKEGWVHLRKSNTEPIIRCYAEAPTEEAAKALSEGVLSKIKI